MQKSEVAQLVAVLFAAFPASRASEATSAVYEECLLDLSGGAARRAVRALIKSSRFLPTVAEIRDECARHISKSKQLPVAPPQERVPYAEIEKLLASVGVAPWPDLLAPEDQPVSGPKLHTRDCRCGACPPRPEGWRRSMTADEIDSKLKGS